MIDVYELSDRSFSKITKTVWWRILNSFYSEFENEFLKNFSMKENGERMVISDDHNSLIVSWDWGDKITMKVQATSQEFAEMVETLFLLTETK